MEGEESFAERRENERTEVTENEGEYFIGKGFELWTECTCCA
jgi:hypothetical protein